MDSAPPLLVIKSEEDHHLFFSKPQRIDWLKKTKRFFFGKRWVAYLKQCKKLLMINKEGFFSLTGEAPGFSAFFKGRVKLSKKSELSQIDSSESGKYCIVVDCRGNKFLLMNMETMDSFDCSLPDSPTFCQWIKGDSEFLISLKNNKILHYSFTETKNRPFSFTINLIHEIPTPNESKIWEFVSFDCADTPGVFFILSMDNNSVAMSSSCYSNLPKPELSNEISESKSEETNSSGSEEKPLGLEATNNSIDQPTPESKMKENQILWKTDLKNAQMRCLAISSCKSCLAVGGLSGLFQIISTKTGEVLNPENSFLSKEDCVFGLDFCPNQPSLILLQTYSKIIAIQFEKNFSAPKTIDTICKKEMFCDYIFSFRVFWDSGYILIGDSDGSVFLSNLKKAENKPIFKEKV